MAPSTKFELLCPLRPQGGSGSLLAFQRGLSGLRRLVVLRPIERERVLDEAQSQAYVSELGHVLGLSHPAIAATHGLEFQGGKLFVAMEFAPGATLAELAKACAAAGEPLPLGVILRAGRDAALALHHAHTFIDVFGRSRSLVHRALGPESLLVGFDGVTRLVDLGFPRPMEPLPGDSCFAFASPEQLRGEPVDARSDLFSLGALLHAAITGMSFTYGELLARAPSRSEFPPPSAKNSEATTALDVALMRTLYPKRESRYPTAWDFVQELDRAAGASMFQPDQSAALVQRLFFGRQAQLKTVVEREERRETTAVMPLSGLFDAPALGADEAPAATQLRPSIRMEEDEAHTPATGQRSVSRNEVSLDAVDPAPTAAFERSFLGLDAPAPTRVGPKAPGPEAESQGNESPLDELPATGPMRRPRTPTQELEVVAASPLSPALPMEPSTAQRLQQPVARRSGQPVLKALILLVFLGAASGVIAWQLNPRWVRSQRKHLAQRLLAWPGLPGPLRSALGPVEPAPPAPAPDMVEKASDAGAEADAGIDVASTLTFLQPLDAGDPTEAGTQAEVDAPLDAGTTAMQAPVAPPARASHHHAKTSKKKSKGKR